MGRVAVDAMETPGAVAGQQAISDAVYMGLFSYNCEQVLELTRLFIELAVMADCHSQAERAQKVEGNIVLALHQGPVAQGFAQPPAQVAQGMQRGAPISRHLMSPSSPSQSPPIAAADTPGSTIISATTMHADLQEAQQWLLRVEAKGHETRRMLENLSDTFDGWHREESRELEQLQHVIRLHETRFRENVDTTSFASDQVREHVKDQVAALEADLAGSSAELRATLSMQSEELRTLHDSLHAAETAARQRDEEHRTRAAEQRRQLDACADKLQEEQRIVTRRMSDVDATTKALESEIFEIRGVRGAWLGKALQTPSTRNTVGSLPGIH